jgi:hypothetical protein
MAQDWNWAFAITYNAILQTSRAYMFFKGYRPAPKQGHKNNFALSCCSLWAGDYRDVITSFNRLRMKRN